MDSRQILEALPHRYPFIMVDRMVELEAGKRGIGLKNFTLNESFFAGHFPGEPIVPGVLIAECLAQTAGLVMCASGDIATARQASGGPTTTGGDVAGAGVTPLVFLAEIRGLKFKRPVVPGEQMTMHVKVVKEFGALAMVDVAALVGEETVAQGELVMARSRHGGTSLFAK
jgi:3-hydroxyacyl-[acyl-carrier-protein] dehydratase